MSHPTYQQTAADFDLWREYVDTDGVMSREKFDAMPLAMRVALMTETFGPDPYATTMETSTPVPTVEEVLRSAPNCPMDMKAWPPTKDGDSVPIDWLEAALKVAFDPADPDWPTKVIVLPLDEDDLDD